MVTARLDFLRFPRWQGAARRLGKLSLYTLLSGLAALLPIAVDRLVVCPLISARLGDETLGAFVWLQGILLFSSNLLVSGLSVGLYREISARDVHGQQALVSTACRLMCRWSLLGLPVVAGLAWWVAPAAVRERGIALVLLLLLVAIVRSVGLLLLNVLSIRRRFGRAVLARTAEAVVLLVLVGTAGRAAAWCIGAAYLASWLIPVSLLFRWNTRLLSWRGGLDATSSRIVSAGFSAGVASALLQHLPIYARFFLGTLQTDLASVAAFFAGCSVCSLFLAPLGVLSRTATLLLAGSTGFALRGHRVFLFLGWLVAGSAASGLAALLAGPTLLKGLYPSLVGQCLPFLPWLALANSFTAGMLLLSPVVLRYGGLRRTVLEVAAAMVVLTVVSLCLVPVSGATGAALAMAASSATILVLWLGALRSVCTTSAVSTADFRVANARRRR